MFWAARGGRQRSKRRSKEQSHVVRRTDAAEDWWRDFRSYIVRWGALVLSSVGQAESSRKVEVIMLHICLPEDLDSNPERNLDLGQKMPHRNEEPMAVACPFVSFLCRKADSGIKKAILDESQRDRLQVGLLAGWITILTLPTLRPTVSRQHRGISTDISFPRRLTVDPRRNRAVCGCNDEPRIPMVLEVLARASCGWQMLQCPPSGEGASCCLWDQVASSLRRRFLDRG